MEAPVDNLSSPNEDTTARFTPLMNGGQRSSSSSSSGIDIQKALDILAERSSCDHHHNDRHNHSHHSHDQGGGRHSHQKEELWSMGQIIDLGGTSSESKTKNENHAAESASSSPEQQAQRRKERLSKMQAELKSMSIKALLQTVLETQQQRVATYKGYNESLNQILQSGNMTAYISSCATATATFAVLSETINGVRTVLLAPASPSPQQHQSNKELERLLANLQNHEKNKLNLTAAHHLERIRERNENIANVHDEADKRISKLLSEGVKSLRQKLDSCVEEINETIEEIRYALFELEEEE